MRMAKTILLAAALVALLLLYGCVGIDNMLHLVKPAQETVSAQEGGLDAHGNQLPPPPPDAAQDGNESADAGNGDAPPPLPN